MPSPRSKSAHLGALIRRIDCLTPPERACLVFFKNLYIRHFGPLYPSTKTVADAIGVSERAARRYISRLRELEILVPLAREHGGMGPVVYEFRAIRLAELAPSPPANLAGVPLPTCHPPPPAKLATEYLIQGKPPSQGKELTWARGKVDSLVGKGGRDA